MSVTVAKWLSYARIGVSAKNMFVFGRCGVAVARGAERACLLASRATADSPLIDLALDSEQFVDPAARFRTSAWTRFRVNAMSLKAHSSHEISNSSCTPFDRAADAGNLFGGYHAGLGDLPHGFEKLALSAFKLVSA